jgi:hypothetical protein
MNKSNKFKSAKEREKKKETNGKPMKVKKMMCRK